MSLEVLSKLVIEKCVNSFVPLTGLAAPTWMHPPMMDVALKSDVVQLVSQVTMSVPAPVLSESESFVLG